MKKVSLPGVLLCFLCLPAAGRAARPPVAGEASMAREAAGPEMAALEMLVGEWEGEAWSQMGPERETIHQQEWIEWAVDGEVLVIRGLGHTVDPETGERTEVHDALATVAWDRHRQRYSMWTYAAGRGPLTPELTVEDGTVVWGFEPPGGGRIRFTIHVDDAGRWVEEGEYSGDGGATWRQFLGMTLERKR